VKNHWFDTSEPSKFFDREYSSNLPSYFNMFAREFDSLSSTGCNAANNIIKILSKQQLFANSLSTSQNFGVSSNLTIWKAYYHTLG
jgi:hypothetical protein